MKSQLSLLSDNTSRPVFTVSEITRRIRQTIERTFGSLTVEGEISNFKHHTSGHMYFALKDSSATLSAVIWRSRAQFLKTMPQDGMKVSATGRLSVYDARGTYQLDVTSLRPVGEGELQAAFERLKKRLFEEGLFDEGRKREVPEYASCVGIVTSPTGAAIQDILNVLWRRFPCVEAVLRPVKVQGIGAAEDIATAIEEFNTWGKADVLIVGRGGGSLEDLWAFNEEVVARALYSSRTPVISAVGHEIDFTIADLVADVRAATPSAAAELAVPDREALLETIRNNWYFIDQNMRNLLEYQSARIHHLLKSYSFNRPVDLLRQYSQRVDDLDRQLNSSLTHRVSMLKVQSDSLRNQLTALDPTSVLRRGYAIVRKEGKVASSRTMLSPGDDVTITLHDGTTAAEVR